MLKKHDKFRPTMILGRILGKLTTSEFQFLVERDTRKFDYVQVYHPTYEWVLCQVMELERDASKTLATCMVIGSRDKEGKVRPVREPFEVGSEVLQAQDAFIASIIRLEGGKRAGYLGKLEGRNIAVRMDLSKLLTTHVAVLAKSGAGKSYTVGVLLEEILECKVPVLVIDPHGEYGTMSSPNTNPKELSSCKEFGVTPKGYDVRVFSLSQEGRPLKLSSTLSQEELLHLLPGKLSGTQLGVLYSALKKLDQFSFSALMLELEKDESNAKWGIMNLVDYFQNMSIFSDSPTPYPELLAPGTMSLLSLKGVNPETQEILVFKVCKDLFELRKLNRIPPFFLVLEEAHNYCPERSFGEAKSSKILRAIASEGRKFGLGLCIVSQRPARVDKSVLSQCTTQIILKVTNPHDLKAVSSSVEGLTASSEREIQNLPIGSALVCGMVDIPLFVTVRPRRSQHGGHAVEMLAQEDFFSQVDKFVELLPVVKPPVSPRDVALMSEEPVQVRTILVPAVILACQDKVGPFKLLIELLEGKVVTNLHPLSAKRLPNLDQLTPAELETLRAAHGLQTFSKDALSDALGKPKHLQDHLRRLSELGYLMKDNKEYAIEKDIIFERLSMYPVYQSVEYISVPFFQKLAAKLETAVVRDRISKFTQVKDMHDCFLLTYQAVPKPKIAAKA